MTTRMPNQTGELQVIAPGPVPTRYVYKLLDATTSVEYVSDPIVENEPAFAAEMFDKTVILGSLSKVVSRIADIDSLNIIKKTSAGFIISSELPRNLMSIEQLTILDSTIYKLATGLKKSMEGTHAIISMRSGSFELLIAEIGEQSRPPQERPIWTRPQEIVNVSVPPVPTDDVAPRGIDPSPAQTSRAEPVLDPSEVARGGTPLASEVHMHTKTRIVLLFSLMAVAVAVAAVGLTWLAWPYIRGSKTVSAIIVAVIVIYALVYRRYFLPNSRGTFGTLR